MMSALIHIVNLERGGDVALNHFDNAGRAIMVDVGAKDDTERIAVTHGFISMNREVFEVVKSGSAKKGDVLGVARVAGIMAVKKQQISFLFVILCY